MFVFLLSSHHGSHKFNYIHLVCFHSAILISHRSSTFFSTFLFPWQFFPPTPFIYFKFPSNIFFAFLIQSSKFHYHFLSINLPYLFSNFALPLSSRVRRLSNISTFLPSSFSLYPYVSPQQTFAPCRSNIFHYRTTPRFRRFVAGLSHPRPGFISRSAHVL